MNRRNFVMSLFGGLAATAAAGTAFAAPKTLPAPLPPGTLDPARSAALDAADTEFTQYYYRNGRRYRGRPPVVRRRVIVRRGPPRRRRVVRRRVIVR